MELLFGFFISELAINTCYSKKSQPESTMSKLMANTTFGRNLVLDHIHDELPSAITGQATKVLITKYRHVLCLRWQVSLTGFLLLEIILGLSSNLTVLVLYCMKQNLISSVSNIITMNLHVVDVLVSSHLSFVLLLSHYPYQQIHYLSANTGNPVRMKQNVPFYLKNKAKASISVPDIRRKG